MERNHPKKAIADAIEYAMAQGWRFQKSKGGSSHAFGRLLCPETGRSGCILSVWTTPRNSENHAKAIRRRVDGCTH